MKGEKAAMDFAAGTQSFFPAQAYNSPAIMQFASMIEGGEKLLDIGCGDGLLMRFLAGRYPQMQFAGLTVLESERASCPGECDVRVGDMHRLPWPENSVDIITSRHSLEHSMAPLAALFEMNRVLRQGGKAYVVVPAPASEWVLRMKDHFSVLHKSMWEKLFGDAGFEIVNFVEGSWLAEASLTEEPEYRFVLRKIKDLGTTRELGDEPADGFEAATATVATTLRTERPIVAVLHSMHAFYRAELLLKQFGVDVKIIVPRNKIDPDNTVQKIADAIAARGFAVAAADLPFEAACEIELSLYPYAEPNVREAKWRVRLVDGFARDAWNFSLENNVYYDFAFTQGDYDSAVLSAFTTPYAIGKMGGGREALQTMREKPRLFCALSVAAPTALEQQYEVVTGDDTAPLADADVVLSDDIDVIAEAIAYGIPAALFRSQKFAGLGDAATLEDILTQSGVVPVTSDEGEIAAVIAAAFGAAKAQTRLRSTLFSRVGPDAVSHAADFLRRLRDPAAFPAAFKAARGKLLERLRQGPAEAAARVVAENQLHGAYGAVTKQLADDLKHTYDAAQKLAAQARFFQGKLDEATRQSTETNEVKPTGS